MALYAGKENPSIPLTVIEDPAGILNVVFLLA